MNATLAYAGTASHILTWIKQLQDEVVRSSSTDSEKPGAMKCSFEIPLTEGMKIEMRWSPEDV